MRSMFLLTTLLVLLIAGYLVIKNMDSHAQKGENGRVEEIEQARKTASQAEERLDAIRKTVNRGDQSTAPVLP